MTNATIRAHMGAECVKPRLLVEKGVAESGPTSHQVDGGVVVVGGTTISTTNLCHPQISANSKLRANQWSN